ncbi:MAG: TonB-dependent receptor [Gammaproteobacteria bacterium]|nr:TonB-dependent receptor [Gammaproteobacteria bacterium]MDE0366088.1 TonB-dependent receptor [Gammaproteobacteria bacterium]
MRVSTNYRFSEQLLGYLNYSEGFRRGGSNAVPTTGIFAELPSFLTFDPDRVKSYEVGLRGELATMSFTASLDFGGAFNNHNTNKYGITLNLRTGRGKEILEELVEVSDVVSENFAKGVLERWGFGYERLKAIKPDIIYISNCGFGHVGPYSDFRSWGPIVQAVSGLTFTSGLPDREPAGWGYSFMDHTGAYYMAIAILMALIHRQRTGEGQWIDLACTEPALALHGPALLDWTHRDPFDRFIAATAIEMGWELVFKDPEFDALDGMRGWRGRVWS